MPTKLVCDHSKLKALRRHALAVDGIARLLGTDTLPEKLGEMALPKGPVRAPLVALRRQYMTTKADMEKAGETPVLATAGNVRMQIKELRRATRKPIPLTDTEAPLVEKRDYGDFVVCVHERMDTASPFRFQPVVCDKTGKELHNIHVRSKTAAVSMRYGVRAVGHFIATGQWPAKQGIPLGPSSGA